MKLQRDDEPGGKLSENEDVGGYNGDGRRTIEETLIAVLLENSEDMSND